MTCSPARLSRRAIMRSGAGVIAGAMLGGSPLATLAQGLSGKITVGFDASNETLAAVIAAAAGAVREANPDAEIEVTPAPAGNFQTQLFLALSTGRAPDVFITTGLGVGELSAGGYLAPLDPFLATWDGWSQYPDHVRAAISYNDSTWALPTVLDAHFLYYRKDLFEEAGIGRDWTPTTLDDVLAAARQVKANVPDVIPYALYAGANGSNATAARGFLPLAFAYGGSLTDENGQVDHRQLPDPQCPALLRHRISDGQDGATGGDDHPEPVEHGAGCVRRRRAGDGVRGLVGVCELGGRRR